MVAKNFGKITPTWRVCIIAAALISLMSCVAMAGSIISAVNVTNHPDRVVISVQADGPMRMGVISSSAGRFLAFQFPCRMTAKGRLVGIHSGRVYNVRYSNFSPNPPATRIVLNTLAHVDHSTEWSADKKRVDITVMKFGRAQAQPAQQLQQEQQPETSALVNKDFIPVTVPEQAKPVTAPAKAETRAIAPAEQIAPALLAAPAPAATAPRIPEVMRSQQTSSVKSTLVPAEPTVIVTSPVVTIPPVFSEPVKTVTTRAQPVQVAVAPAVEHIAKGSDSGTAEAPKTVSLAPKVTERPRPAISKRVSLNFLGADIHDVLKALSTQSNTNIVAGKDVSGSVTVSLNNVGVEEALDYVAKLSGYNYAKENETYLVGSRGSIEAITNGTAVGPKVMVVQVRYCNVKNMIEVLKNQFPDMKFANGNGSDEKDTKSIGGVIVVSGAAETVDPIKSVIEQIDESMRGISQDGDSDVYYVKYVSISELKDTLESLYPGVRIVPAPSDGFSLNAPNSAEGGAPSTANAASAAASTSASAGSSSGDVKLYSSRSPGLIIYGAKAVIQKVMETAAKLDVKPPMIKIEAKVTSLNETGEKKLGLTWSWGDFNKIEVAPNHWQRQPIDFVGTLDALIKSGDGKLLAAPNLMCIEGKPGSFFVGDKVRYILYVEQTDNGKNIKTEEANVGIELRVAGDVSPEGYITMSLHPEVSVLQLNKDQATGITLPLITRRYTDHVVRVKNGETIVIGGLISDSDIVDMQKVPLLGDIPLFGHLFRHKSTTKEHTEVVIFITATVVKD